MGHLYSNENEWTPTTCNTMGESHLLLTVTLWGSSYHYSHFADEETEHREEKLLSKTTKLGSGEVRMQTLTVEFQHLMTKHHYPQPLAMQVTGV